MKFCLTYWGSALNDNAGTIGVSRDGEPWGPEFIHEDDF